MPQHVLMIPACLGLCLLAAAKTVPIELICIDPESTHYGTFQSHNQKVVSNAHGIFTTHIRSRNEPYTAQQWRLSRSTNGGRTFATVYEATHATNPPVLETDEGANIYLVRPDFGDGHAYLYRFLAAEDYADAHVSRIPNGSAGKFCMSIDQARERLYYFAHNNTFHTLDLAGNLLRSVNLLKPGANAVLQYPLLYLTPRGVLHAAWTTQKHGVYLYWDIHHMLSEDAGESWRTMDGKPVDVPVVADNGGAATLVSLPDEFEAHTWLSSFLCKGGKVHMLYLAQTDPPRQHYVRYDVVTGDREVDLQPEFRGETFALQGLDGFFASAPHDPASALYCVVASSGRIGCLISRDNGSTWHDYALSVPVEQPYSIGGCRQITADGYVIGTFTSTPSVADAPSQVWFLRIKTGL